MERFSFTVGIGRIYLVIRSLFHQIANRFLSNRFSLGKIKQISLEFSMYGDLVLFKESGSVDRNGDTASLCYSVRQIVQPFSNGTSIRQIVRSRFNVAKLPFSNPLISPPSRASPVYYLQ